MAAGSALCPVLVGRQEEVEALRAGADARQLLLVAGEAGVGKSRLVSEALRLAHGRGWHQMAGSCTAEAGVPYGPFVSAVRRRTRALEEAALVQLFDGAALLASALLPEAARLVGLPESVAPREEDLFAAVWQLLARLAAPAGAVLALEDLHWADAGTLRLLSYLSGEAADLPVWLVGTYRSDELHRRHPLAAVLAELGRLRRYRELRLASLGRDDLRLMVSAILDGTEVGDEFLDAVLERTGGNPFFVEELIKVLLERGDVFRKGGEWARRELADIEMPLTVRESLLARTRTLGDEARRALQTAALAGDRLDIDVVAAAAGLDRATVADAVSEGLRLQLLVERRDGPASSYRFRHALTREALADELVGPERQRVHLCVAEAVRAAHDGDLDPVAAVLAEHYAEAGEAGLAAEFAVRAARFACSSYALEEAGRRYDDALRLRAGDDAGRLELLLEAAEALLEGPDHKLVAAFAAEAAELARRRGDPLGEGRALSAWARPAWWEGDTPRALEMTRRALELVHGRDDFREALLVARLVRILTLADMNHEAEARLAEGIALAGRSQNFAALSFLEGTALILAGYGAEFEVHYRAALEAARRGGQVTAEENLATIAGYVSLWCGDFAASRRHLTAAMELAERYAPSSRYAEAGYLWLLSLTGRYAEVEERAPGLVGRAHVPSAIVALCALYEVAERRGDTRAGALVEELWAKATRTGEAQRTVPALAARARHALLHEGAPSATPLFWEVLRDSSADTRASSHWMFSVDLARALHDEGLGEELERWVGAVRRLTERDPQPHNLAADGLCRAHLASARGEPGAAALFEAAAAAYEAMPCPARQAEALIGLAEHLGGDERRGPSAEAAHRALEVSGAIGAHALARRAEAALSRAEEPPLLATVLFTDIVGSTRHLAAMGDRAWRQLLERHNSLVRRELAHWRGHEVETTGDGFLAWFDTPAQGIRCALALGRVLQEAGITIRAGLHTGECQLSGGRLSGIAVHIAARVSALAGAGDVLVSRTVRDLAAGAGFSFAERGVHELKGVEGDWQLFAVSS